MKSLVMAVGLSVAVASFPAPAPAQDASVKPAHDAALAGRVGADERGMRRYVLVILKTGPTRVPEGEERKAMFAGHFANMKRLSDQGKLVLAGPFGEGAGDWRGLYVFATTDVDEARRLTATDPVIVKGEMVAEYRSWYGTAAMMLLPELHEKIAPPPGSGE